uniref:Uncharacterized protein n=1 Tax=Panagrolaimus sp. ES5 TaxID=591445 RepID=A0AC34G0M9_9BILA
MTSSLIGMSLFEDKGKPRNPFMKMITVNQQSENNIKNGRTRTRNAVDEDETLHHFSSFQSTTNFQIPSSQTLTPDKTLQITLKVNCKENRVTIENRNSDIQNVHHSSPIISPQPFVATKNRVTIENQNSDVQNVHHSSISPQPFVATRENHFHPSIPTTTAKSSQVSSQQVTNVEKTHVLAQPVDDDPPPQKTHTKRGRYLLKSGTPNPNVRYYTKDEVDHVLAEDY